MLNSDPWSTVSIDGRVIGPTPIMRHELPPGAHAVEFVCGGCAEPETKRYEVTIKSGAGDKRVVRFGG